MATLKEFLEIVGDETAADIIGVTKRAVASWRRGERYPRPGMANRIISISRQHPAGPIDHAGIYGARPNSDSDATGRSLGTLK